jgi:hypothetical protein
MYRTSPASGSSFKVHDERSHGGRGEGKEDEVVEEMWTYKHHSESKIPRELRYTTRSCIKPTS